VTSLAVALLAVLALLSFSADVVVCAQAPTKNILTLDRLFAYPRLEGTACLSRAEPRKAVPIKTGRQAPSSLP